MSIFFQVTGATKAKAVEEVKANLDNIVAADPLHSTDKDILLNVVQTYVDLIEEPVEDQHVFISVAAELVNVGTDEEPKFRAAALNIGAQLKD